MFNNILSALIGGIAVFFATQGTSESTNVPPSAVTGFSVFHARPGDHAAFRQDLRPLIEASRSEPGAVSYDMYENPLQPGAIGFVERYKDEAALKAHLGSSIVAKTFGSEYYKEIKAKDPEMFGPWMPVSPAPATDEKLELVFYWTMDCPKQHVWDVITDWNDASWVLGSPKTILRDVDPSICKDGRVQRRQFNENFFIDVCLVSKDDKTFVTVQETVGGLRFPNVTYDTFFVTLSLDDEGLDSDTQSRMRYHTQATLSKGTWEEGRSTLKDDFYGPRIAFYQQFFNCTKGIFLKRAESSVASLHDAIRGLGGSESTVNDAVAPFFANNQALAAYVAATPVLARATSVSVTLPVATVALPDLRVVTVEDVTSTSALGTQTTSRIVIYQLDDHGKIVSLRVFDESIQAHMAMDRYFETIKGGDKEAVRKLYTADAILEDPVGFMPPRTFDSVYDAFYSIASSFEYARSPQRTYKNGDQVAQVVDASFVLASGGELRATPVQVFTFDKSAKITHFEAFFKPHTIDFSKL